MGRKLKGATSGSRPPKRRDWGRAGQLVFLGAAFALAGWLFYAHFFRLDFKVNKRPFASLGVFAADELAKIVPAGRVQVVYDVPDRAAAKQPRFAKPIEMQAVEAEAFKSRLASVGEYSFLDDVQLPRSAMAMASAWPRDTFPALLNTPDSTIVLFSSLPRLGQSERNLLEQRPGKLAVVGMSVLEIFPAVEAKLVDLAVANRIPIPRSQAPTETPAAWVQRVFTVLTPATVHMAR